MARVFIQDLWLKAADDGTLAPAAQRRSLTAASDPFKADVSMKWRSKQYGHGARWRCQWYVFEGNGRRVRSKSFQSLREAEAFKSAVENDARRGVYYDPKQGQRLFSAVADAWLDSKLNLKASTRARYERELRMYINPRWGGVPLAEFTMQDVQAWVNQLADGTHNADMRVSREPKPLKPRSIRNIVKIVMGGVLAYAKEQQWIGVNPLDGVVLPKLRKADTPISIFTMNQVEQLADMAGKIGGESDATLIRFLAYTGVRVNEALALQVRDLNYKLCQAVVSRTFSDDGKGGVALTSPKSNKARNIAIPEFLITPLQHLTAKRKQHDFVFRSRKGMAILVHNWRNRVWYPALRAAGLNGMGYTIHSLRHTYASIAIAQGADVKTLQAQLGHASATITLDTYASLWPNRLNDIASALNAARHGMLGGSE